MAFNFHTKLRLNSVYRCEDFFLILSNNQLRLNYENVFKIENFYKVGIYNKITEKSTNYFC